MKPLERVGLELELLAPPGSTRFDLARALAKDAGGALRLGFKYHGHGELPDGRPDCQLTPAARVLVKGKWLCSVVDDPTIVDDLAPSSATLPIARTDDVRLAGWIERHCWAAREPWRPLLRTFSATKVEDGLVDPWGLPLVRWHAQSAERARVCEVVLAPLAGKQLARTVQKVMERAGSLGFTVPKEAAVHAHFDAAPFRATPALRRLILAWEKEQARLRKQLQPNPHCRKLGPHPANVLRVAREAGDELSFDTLAAGLLLAGLRREVDLNLLGVVERFPKQPTVEVRCLPGSLDAAQTLEKVALARDFLSRVLRG